MQNVLDGEFDFFGLISTCANVSAVLRDWTYQRLSAHTVRTIRCSAIHGVPYGHDVWVLRALLLIRQQTPGRPQWIQTAVSGLRAALRQLGAPGPSSDAGVLASLLRLDDAVLTVQYGRRRGRGLSVFALTDALEVFDLHNINDGQPERVLLSCILSSQVCWLAEHGAFEAPRDVPDGP